MRIFYVILATQQIIISHQKVILCLKFQEETSLKGVRWLRQHLLLLRTSS